MGNATPDRYTLPKSVGPQSDGFGAWIATIFYLVLASTIATEVTAARLSFNPELGEHLHLPLIGPAYSPWNCLAWAWQFSPYATTIYAESVRALVYAALLDGMKIGAVAAAPVTFLAVLGIASIRGGGSGMVRDLSDSSGAWATEEDVRSAGLFASCGPILGAFPTSRGLRTMRYGGDSGISVTAPPAGGKTSGWLVPNLTCLLAHPEGSQWTAAQRRAHPWGEEPSHFVLDIRGYLAKATSGWRRHMGHDVFILEPFSTKPGRAKLNPLWSIDVGGIRMYDHCYQAALDAVGDTDGLQTSATTYWDQASTAFLAAVIGHLAFASLYRNEPTLLSYSSVINFICDFPSIEDLLLTMQFTRHDPHGVFTRLDGDEQWKNGQCEWIARCTRAMSAKEKEERSGVFGTLAERLNVFRSPVIKQHIEESTFTFRELANGERPGCVYLSIPGMKLDHARPLTRAIVSHALRELTEDGSESQHGREVRGNLRTVVLQLDEIASAKTIATLASSAGFLRGHGVFLALFWQSTAQLAKWYGKDETLSETLRVHAFQTPNTHHAAKEWSEDLGSFSTALTKRSSSSHGAGSDVNASVDIHSRPLLTPGEVLRLPRDETVLLAFGQKIRAKTFAYHRNAALRKRTQLPPVKHSDVTVSEPYFIERLAATLGRDKIAVLLSPPPVLPKPPPPPYEPTMLEQNILDEEKRRQQRA